MHQKVILILITTDPYWRSPNKESKPLQAYVGNFTLPTTFPVEFGSSGASTEINNTSGSPVPVEIEIRGPITNPKIFNRTSDEFIQINRSISDRKSTRLNSSHVSISYAVFCLKKKK